MDKISSSKESTAKLREALCKLESYSLEATESISSVSKTISLMRAIFASPFDSHQKKHRHQRHPPNKNEVLIAVELINRNRLLIEKLKEGTPAEKELAEQVTKTINAYNESCDKRIQGYMSNRQRLTNFFSKSKPDQQILPKIALPKKVSVQRHYPENVLPKPIQKLDSKTALSVPLSKQSAELFHMKAIALLERYGIASNPEARDFVRTSPIHTTCEEGKSICTLSQTLSLFPGQTIVVMGNSALDPKTQAIRQFLPETFCLSLESTQTGFPHPIQRAGWTLASQLLPDFPQRLDLLNETAELFKRRHQTVTELVQQGDLLKHAKYLLALKKICFDSHAKELLDLHKTFTKNLLNAAGAETAAYEASERFYLLLSKHPSPFSLLADTSQLLIERFMVKPHQSLLNAIIKGKSTNLGSNHAELRYKAAKILLNQAVDLAKQEMNQQTDEAKLVDEHIKFDFIKNVGSLLGDAAKQIFLQYLSEDLVYLPPKLTPFEDRIQAMAYGHLKDFLDELSTPLTGDSTVDQELVYALLKRQISSDIALFNDNASSTIPQELTNYFQKRYISLSAL